MESEEVPGYLSEQKLEEILQEIAQYQVKLEEDPTLPTLGYAYLQRSIAECRRYLNRTQFYLQTTRRFEKNLRSRIREFEMDLELKMAQKLADDPIVRQQPAAQDRKAVAISMLQEEHKNLAGMRVELINVEETVKLIKMKYDDLHRTNMDVKLQRQLVKDDRMEWEGGGEGYTRPQKNPDGTVPGGLAPPVRSVDIEAEELLEGVTEGRQDQEAPREADGSLDMADFLSGKTLGTPPAEPANREPEPEPEGAPVKAMSYDDLLG